MLFNHFIMNTCVNKCCSPIYHKWIIALPQLTMKKHAKECSLIIYRVQTCERVFQSLAMNKNVNKYSSVQPLPMNRHIYVNKCSSIIYHEQIWEQVLCNHLPWTDTSTCTLQVNHLPWTHMNKCSTTIYHKHMRTSALQPFTTNRHINKWSATI